MAARKNFRVRLRGKVRNRLLRRGGAAAGLTFCLLLGGWLCAAAFKSLRGVSLLNFFSFAPSSFEVDCPYPGVSAAARGLLSPVLNSSLNSKRCASLSSELRRLHPGLAYAAVNRNFFTGKVKMKARAEEVVSPVLLNGATAYLGVTGRLLSENLYGAASTALPVEISGAASPAPGLAAFLKELAPGLRSFAVQPVKLSCSSGGVECRLDLADGSGVLWGGFEFTRLKVIRLNQVIKDVSVKRRGPFCYDLRLFKEGKIFVSLKK